MASSGTSAGKSVSLKMLLVSFSLQLCEKSIFMGKNGIPLPHCHGTVIHRKDVKRSTYTQTTRFGATCSYANQPPPGQRYAMFPPGLDCYRKSFPLFSCTPSEQRCTCLLHHGK